MGAFNSGSSKKNKNTPTTTKITEKISLMVEKVVDNKKSDVVDFFRYENLGVLVSKLEKEVIFHQNIGLLDDLLEKVFTLLCPTHLVSVMFTCRHWYLIAHRESIWEIICNKLSLYDKPFKYLWRDWFRQTYFFGLWDTTKNLDRLKYSFGKRRVEKYDGAGYSDVSIAVVGRPISSGKVFIEFKMLTKGDEYYFGVTDNPEKILTVLDSSIIQHPNTWAYTCGKRYGINAQRVTYPAECFSKDDKIGVFLNLDDGLVSFFKNKVKQYQELALPKAASYQFFAMLDREGDILEICEWDLLNHE